MASPRRALAPIDANKQAPPPPPTLKSPAKNALKAGLFAARPVLARAAVPAGERKRALEVEERVVKRSCTGVASPARSTPNVRVARDSVSPDASSVFDADVTHTTASSLEGDRQRIQARKMAGDLLARLRLAKYKVRTGQTHIPFPQLEARAPRTADARPPPAAPIRNAGDAGGSERGTAAEDGPGTGARGGAASLVRLSQGSP